VKAEGDERLLRFLYDKRHSTPFEFAGMVIEVQAPIMVFREWHRHRTQSYSEASARYAPLPALDYVPTLARVMRGAQAARDTKNRQAQAHGAVVLDEAAAGTWLDALADHYQRTQELYERGLARGIPKELARLVLTVGRYSKMRAVANLRNWLAFATLRSASDAQEEISVYSDVLVTELAKAFPKTLELFMNVRRGP
jgi:thymidylate synthase (FAD)